MSKITILPLVNFIDIDLNSLLNFRFKGETENSQFQFELQFTKSEYEDRIIKELRVGGSSIQKVSQDLLVDQIRNALYLKLFFNHSIKITNIDFLEHQYNLTTDKKLFLKALKGLIDPLKYALFTPDIANLPEIMQEFYEWINRKLGSIPNPAGEEVWLVKKYPLISELHKLCVDENIFEEPHISLNDFHSCFSLSVTHPIHPKFKRKGQIKFVYILTQIEDMNAKRAKERFGISSYKTQKSRLLNENPPNQNFINAVNRIINGKQIIKTR